jgi:hypothetical protein
MDQMLRVPVWSAVMDITTFTTLQAIDMCNPFNRDVGSKNIREV